MLNSSSTLSPAERQNIIETYNLSPDVNLDDPKVLSLLRFCDDGSSFLNNNSNNDSYSPTHHHSEHQDTL